MAPPRSSAALVWATAAPPLIQDSGSGFRIRIQDLDSGSGFRIRIQDPDSGPAQQRALPSCQVNSSGLKAATKAVGSCR